MNKLTRTLSIAGAAALAAQAPASAQDTDPIGETAQGDLAVTIYNNGQALVQDVRQLPIAQGRS
ncbi:MAG TPA: DUF4139 domain-containing protein, partial [Croceibacterium sp.]|nr:DUF4139 domain-containing protein [Croceibacterium sp.]